MAIIAIGSAVYALRPQISISAKFLEAAKIAANATYVYRKFDSARRQRGTLLPDSGSGHRKLYGFPPDR
jgi:hypothetical protein